MKKNGVPVRSAAEFNQIFAWRIIGFDSRSIFFIFPVVNFVKNN
jgi:hypothetical protein